MMRRTIHPDHLAELLGMLALNVGGFVALVIYLALDVSRYAIQETRIAYERLSAFAGPATVPALLLVCLIYTWG